MRWRARRLRGMGGVEHASMKLHDMLRLGIDGPILNFDKALELSITLPSGSQRSGKPHRSDDDPSDELACLAYRSDDCGYDCPGFADPCSKTGHDQTNNDNANGYPNPLWYCREPLSQSFL